MIKIIMVPVIMVCATAGTVGLLKIIKKIMPEDVFPKDPISRKLEEENEKQNN